jgi:hypothetical protein
VLFWFRHPRSVSSARCLDGKSNHREHRLKALLDELAQLGTLAAASSWPNDYTRNLAEIARFVEETTRIEAVRDRDYDGLEAELRGLLRLRSWGWLSHPNSPRE